MRIIAILSSILVVLLSGCNSDVQQSKAPLTGVINNPSSEIVVSSVVKDWNTDPWLKGVIHFYDNVAHEGYKSLFIDAPGYSYGIWHTNVLLKPWSKYRFSGWVRTSGLVVKEGRGAGFNISGIEVEPKGLTGDNDWTRIDYEFSTEGNDCATIECLLNVDGEAKGRAWFDDMSLELISSEKILTSLNIDVSKTKEPMPVYIYGQFIEHLGRCIYGGIWAEMVNDRKFWYAPGAKESPWQNAGPEGFYAVDSDRPFTGEHSPVLISDGNEKGSLVQKNLGTRAGVEIIGHIVLKSSNAATSAVISLSWGEKKGESIEAKLTGLTNEYKAYPFKFDIPVSSHDVSLKISPKGKGKIWIGTVSLMPGDNIEGFRADVLALLKELNSPVYRWPGGNFVSGYDWTDGIGDRDSRPPRKNPAWSGVESNDVGIHEFMRLCELINTEAYIAVNAGLGGSDMACREVEYVNGSENTPMGKLRASNGHSSPWKVKWWSVGNEMFGDWQLGFMNTEKFTEKHNDFAKAMKAVSPDIKLIAVGDVGKWDELVLSNCSENMDLISEHFYVQDWHGGGLMTHVRQVPDAIRKKAEAHRQYRETIPALKGKNIRICMDEWNYWYGPHVYGELGTRYFFRDAMGIAAGLNEYSRNTDIIYMANYAQTVNVIGAIKTNTTDAVLDATGMVLKLYRKRFGTVPVAITGETRPLDVAATLTSDGDTLTISVINPTYDAVSVPLSLAGASATGEILEWNVYAIDDMSTNEPGREPSVLISGPLVSAKTSSLSVKPVSISIFVIPIRK